MIEENPDSINDGYFLITGDFSMVPEWGDYPAAFHNHSVGLGFADGHAEVHRWTGGALLQHVTTDGSAFSPGIYSPQDGQDFLWLAQRTSVRY